MSLSPDLLNAIYHLVVGALLVANLVISAHNKAN